MIINKGWEAASDNNESEVKKQENQKNGGAVYWGSSRIGVGDGFISWNLREESEKSPTTHLKTS